MSETLNDIFNISSNDRNTFFNNSEMILSRFQLELLDKIDKQIKLFANPNITIYEDYSVIYLWIPNKYIKTIKQLKEININIKEITVKDDPIIILEISPGGSSYLTGRGYLSINNWVTNQLTYISKTKTYDYPSRSKYSKYVRLDIYDLYKIYFHGNGKSFPMTLKALDYFKKDEFKYFYSIINLLFEYGLSSDLIWKDLVNKSSDWQNIIYPPIKFSELKNMHNKKELLEKKFKKTLPNSINKDSITIGYYKTKAALLFKEDEWQKFFNLEVNDDFIDYFYTEEERANKIIHIFYEKRFKQKFSKMEGYRVEDYLHMSRILKLPISLKFKTYNGLIKQHDKLAEKIKLNDMPIIKIPKRSIFLKLKLPKKYELITTKERLYKETVMNANCVWSYAEDINNGDCVIYSLVENNNRYTIEIAEDFEGNLYISQMYGYKNSPCPVEYIDELLMYLEEFNTGDLHEKK